MLLQLLSSVTADSQCSLAQALRVHGPLYMGVTVPTHGALWSQWCDLPLHPATWLREVAA